jgi:hypothetical protein
MIYIDMQIASNVGNFMPQIISAPCSIPVPPLFISKQAAFMKECKLQTKLVNFHKTRYEQCALEGLPNIVTLILLQNVTMWGYAVA